MKQITPIIHRRIEEVARRWPDRQVRFVAAESRVIAVSTPERARVTEVIA